MKRISIIIGILTVWLVFTGCQGPTVGYLITEDVTYPIDSMVVMTYPRLEQEIINLEKAKIDFDLSEEGKAILKKKEELEAKSAIYEHKTDSISEIMWEIDDQMWELGPNDEQYAILEKLYNELLDARHELYRQWDEIDEQIKEVMQVRNEVIGNIEHEILLLQRRVQDTIPWTSSPVEGVMGTEPIIYSIARITGEDATKTSLFTKYLTIIGGGRFILHWSKTELLPAGRYEISIQVTNEGYSRIIDNVFTFIVKDVNEK